VFLVLFHWLAFCMAEQTGNATEGTQSIWQPYPTMLVNSRQRSPVLKSRRKCKSV